MNFHCATFFKKNSSTWKKKFNWIECSKSNFFLHNFPFDFDFLLFHLYLRKLSRSIIIWNVLKGKFLSKVYFAGRFFAVFWQGTRKEWEKIRKICENFEAVQDFSCLVWQGVLNYLSALRVQRLKNETFALEELSDSFWAICEVPGQLKCDSTANLYNVARDKVIKTEKVNKVENLCSGSHRISI